MLSFYFHNEYNTIQTYNTGGFLSEHAETKTGTDENCLQNYISGKKSVIKIGLAGVKN
jgi:hypothetical protein